MPEQIPLFIRWAGMARYAPTPPRRLLEEPHRLVLEAKDKSFLVKQCDCDACAADQEMVKAPLVPLNELADWLTDLPEENKPDVELPVVLSEEMASTLPDGTPTASAMYAMALAEAINARGIASRVVVEKAQVAYTEGTWLRAVAETADSMTHVLLPGMVGRAVVTNLSYVICTPGVSQMTLIEGRTEPYGHAWDALEPLEQPPTQAEIEYSRKLCGQAAEDYQRRNGWMGYLTILGEVFHEGIARQEIERFVGTLPDLWERDQEACAADTERLVLLLRAMAVHPNGADLAAVAGELAARVRSAPDVALLAKVTAWLASNPVMPDVDKEKTDEQIRQMKGIVIGKSLCSVCGRAPVDQVHASAFGPNSFGDCSACREKGAEPYNDVVAFVAIIWRGYEHLDDALRQSVAASCTVAGKTLEQFLADVAERQSEALPDDRKEPTRG